MERRIFLASGAAAVTALGASDKINSAVVGLGGRGRYHVTRWLDHPAVNVAALCDIDTAQTDAAIADAVAGARGPDVPWLARDAVED